MEKAVDRYSLLAMHLKQAADAARPLADTEDGGTCNFDQLELIMPGWRAKSVLAAATKAGLQAWEFGRGVFCFLPPVRRQGDARTRQAEKMRDVMASLGYEATVYYQMD